VSTQQKKVARGKGEEDKRKKKKRRLVKGLKPSERGHHQKEGGVDWHGEGPEKGIISGQRK